MMVIIIVFLAWLLPKARIELPDLKPILNDRINAYGRKKIEKPRTEKYVFRLTVKIIWFLQVTIIQHITLVSTRGMYR